MSTVQESLALTDTKAATLTTMQKVGGLIGSVGLLGLFISIPGQRPLGVYSLPILVAIMAIGLFIYTYASYSGKPEGIKNHGVFHSTLTHRGLLGWVAGILLTGFYILLYWYPELLGLGNGESGNSGVIKLFDSLSYAIKGVPASQWFMYGTLYTIAIFLMGIKFIIKYAHNTYQKIRTLSVMGFQLFFAYMIPELLEGLNSEYQTKWFDKDVKNMWPLDYDFFDAWHIDNMSNTGILGWGFLIFSLAMIFIISPFLTYKYGKRWYCSWVCGCGGLAETAGDPWRHLSDKSLKAWKIERWIIHSILVFVVVMTIAVVYGYLGNNPEQYYITKGMFTGISIGLLVVAGSLFYLLMKKREASRRKIMILVGGTAGLISLLLLINFISGSGNAFFIDNYSFKKWYGFAVGAAFSGVIGVGFYPLMGTRVWCRFGCPMAAILGLQQKLLSRFRITTNGSQCISCGNCSTYCEMGIDVRSYAQKGQNIVRSSCVGCGICAAVCPRGVLRLENGSVDLFDKDTELKAIHVSESSIGIL